MNRKVVPANEKAQYLTRHGPVLFQDSQRNRAYALKWVGNEPGGAAYLRSLAMARTRNQQEFFDSLSAWKVPGLNFVYADVDGTIGWIAAARTPVRPRHDGLLPVPRNGGFEWVRRCERLSEARNERAYESISWRDLRLDFALSFRVIRTRH